MSLKRMAMKMALAYAATKGVQAFRNNGGMSGLKRSLNQAASGGGAVGGQMGAGQSHGMQGRVGGTGTTTGGLGSILGALGGGGAGGTSAGLGGLLGALGGGSAASAAGGSASSMGQGMSGGGMGGLLGGLAAMAGGSAALQGSQDDMAAHAGRGPSDEDTARAMIRAMAMAVRADGEIDAQERDVLMELLDDAADPGDRDAVEAALREPIDPEGLARDVPAGHEAEVYAAALTAIDPDRAEERAFLQRFATALDMRPSEVAALHEAQDKPV